MTEPRAIAEVTDYESLIAALRARVGQLGIAYATIDQIAGWTDTYATKLLGAVPIKHLGPMSFGAMLGALGVKLVMVEDAAALERAQRNRNWAMSPRAKSKRTADADKIVILRFSMRHMKKLAKKAVEARMKKISPKRRSELARLASNARWARHRAKAAEGSKAPPHSSPQPAAHAADTSAAAAPQAQEQAVRRPPGAGTGER